MPADTVLLYCQHSLGIGHLTRSFALAAALRERFRVVFLNGGPLPPGLDAPEGIERVDLPPLGMDEGHALVSRQAGVSVAAARAERQALIAATTARVRPAALVLELFPFGRMKFIGELLPLIRQVRRQPRPAAVVCSLRDILVDARRGQVRHDRRARWLADRCLDAVFVHADAAFARLEDSFRPDRPLGVPVHYTGFVTPHAAQAAGAGFAEPVGPGAVVPTDPLHAPARGRHLLVSAGGGAVGAPLLEAVLAARDCLSPAQAWPLRLVAGPFLPEPAWQALQAAVAQRPGVSLVRQVPRLVDELRQARASISQYGYNTALDLLAAGTPALVAPYDAPGENEQRRRAERLAALDALCCLPPGPLTPERLGPAIDRLLRFVPRPQPLAMDGAAETTRLLAALVAGRHAVAEVAP